MLTTEEIISQSFNISQQLSFMSGKRARLLVSDHPVDELETRLALQDFTDESNDIDNSPNTRIPDHQIDENDNDSALICTSPDVACEPDGNYVYYGWIEADSTSSDKANFRYATSSGSSLSSITTIRRAVGVDSINIINDGAGKLYYFVVSQASISSDYRLYVYHSYDNGANWSSPTRLDNQSSTTVGVLPVHKNGFNLSGGLIVASYIQEVSSVRSVKFVKSTDYGITWTTPATLNSVSNVTADAQCVIGNSNIHYAAWLTGNNDKIYYTRTTDGGSTWVSPTPLYRAGVSATDVKFKMKADQFGNVYILAKECLDEDSSGYLWLLHSVDYGDTWPREPIRLSSAVTLGFTFDIFITPGSSLGTTYVYITWNDGNQVKFLRSTDGGITFDSVITWNDTISANPYSLQITALRNRVCVAWEKFPDGNKVVQYQVSHSRGDSWADMPQSASDGALGDATGLDVAIDNFGFIYPAWLDRREGETNLIERVWANNVQV